ncbi:MAG: GNAT family N-acetyltransferase, partial [Balneolaceae bacterium]|nr:GNAT family N-acetyltransferase [Balneolaceae bacterium]
GVLIGLAPLFEGKSSIGPLNLQSRLHLMGSGVGEQELLGFHDEYGRSDFLDILAEPEQEEEVARCLVAFLQQDNLNFDLIALQHLRDEGFTKRVLLPQLEEQHIDYEIENTDICPYVTLSEFDTLEEYIGELSSNTRRRLRQTLRAIGEEDGYELEEVETVDQLLEELEILRNMHQERWNGFGYPGAFFDRRFVRFMEEFVQVAYDKGWIWFKQAIDESGHAATRLSLKFNNRFYDYMSGFDDSSPSTKYRPGIGLLTVMIKEAIENGSPEIVELLRGDEGYKFDLTSQVKKNWRVSIPLRSNRSLIRKALSGLLKTAAAVHAAVQREWTLMKVQRHLEGPARMVFSYITTRYSMLKYKYQQD